MTGERDTAPASRAEISRATAAEADTVAWLVREGFRSEAERYGIEIPPMREVAEDVRSALDAGDVVLIARLDGKPAGTVRGHAQEDDRVMVRRLAVLPDARRRGVGRQLMETLEAAYAECPRFEIFTGTDTRPAIALYESLGYGRTREVEEVPGVTIVYLEKRRA